MLKFWQEMTERRKDGLILLGLVAIIALIYCYGMGTLSLTEPDEVFYAQTAKEMLQHNTWSTPFIFGKPQFEKPILYYFLLAAGFKFFGISTVTARIWSALFGILGTILTYLLGKRIYNRRAGFIAALVLATSMEYLSLSRAVLTDIVFCALLASGMTFFYFGYLNQKKRGVWFYWAFVSYALAVLTKGPIGIILPLGIIFSFLFLRKELKIFFSKKLFLGLFVFAVVALPWYLWIYKNFGRQFIDEFFVRDNINRFFFVAEHQNNNTWYYYTATTLGGFLPWSPFLIAGLYKLFRSKPDLPEEKRGVLFLCCWVAIIFIFFSFAKSKLISYVFPIFPALAIITAGYLDRLIEQREGKLSTGFALSMLFLAILFISGGVYGFYYNKTAHFLPKQVALIPLICLGLPVFAAFILSLFKRYKEAIAAVVLAITALVITGESSLVKYIEPLVSSRASIEALKNYIGNEKTVLLCNKSFARGLFYYSGFPVVVMDSSPNPFFAPHPITVLYKDEQIRQFLLNRPQTFCVVKKSNLKKIETLTSSGFYLTTIYQDKERYIVKVAPKK